MVLSYPVVRVGWPRLRLEKPACALDGALRLAGGLPPSLRYGGQVVGGPNERECMVPHARIDGVGVENSNRFPFRECMQKYLLVHFVFPSLALFALSGCMGVPKSVREITLDDMYPILTTRQYDTLKSRASDKDMNQFLDRYWQIRDSTSGLREGGSRAEYLRRLQYANARFPDRRGWGRSDRKRIHLVYGPPKSVERYEYSDIRLGSFSIIKSLEIWLYGEPAKNRSFPSFSDAIYPGEKRFIFGDLAGSGVYTLLYSSEDGAATDSRWSSQH